VCHTQKSLSLPELMVHIQVLQSHQLAVALETRRTRSFHHTSLFALQRLMDDRSNCNFIPMKFLPVDPILILMRYLTIKT
jgi:hypothetical protein